MSTNFCKVSIGLGGLRLLWLPYLYTHRLDNYSAYLKKKKIAFIDLDEMCKK